MTVALAVLLLQLLMPLAASAFNPKDYQTAIIRTVFDRIITAVGDAGHPPPRLTVDTTRMVEAAYYNAMQRTLHVDAGLVDLCRKMGRDSLNALAAVMTHELAHHYLGHGLFDAHERGSQRALLKGVVDWRVTRETEADFYGGIYGHLAGYDPYAMPRVLDMLYSHYGYSDGSHEYLNLDQRKDVAMTIDDSLRRLIPVFDMATNLTLSRFYPLARSCYDYLIVRFPSREMFNNAGMTYAMQAVELIGGTRASYTYPFELDEDTRLSNVKITRGKRDRSTRSPTPSDTVLANRLIDSAEARFINAAEKDPGYGPALINLASIAIIRGRPGDASALAERATEHDTALQTHVLALIVKAIASANMGRTDKARQGLKGIIAGAGDPSVKYLAQANLAVIDSGPFSTPFDIGRMSIESVDDISVTDTAVTTYRGDTRELIGGDSALWVLSRQRDSSIILRAQTSTRWIQFVCPGMIYARPSAKGVAVGDPAEAVLTHYGPTPRIVSARQGRYYVYDYSKIIFLIGDDGKVVRWMAYGVGALAKMQPPAALSSPKRSTSPRGRKR